MPRRRSIGSRVGQGVSQGVAGTLQMLLQSRLLQRRQQDQREMLLTGQRQNHLLNELSGLSKDVEAGNRDADSATAMQDQLIAMLGPEFTGYRREFETPVRRRIGEIGAEFKDSPLNIPDDTREFVRGQAQLAGVLPDELTAASTTPMSGPMAGFPLVTGDPTERPEIGIKRRELDARRDTARAGVTPMQIQGVDAQGVGTTELIRPFDVQPGGRTVQREASPEQKAGQAATQLRTESDLGVPTMRGEATKTEKLTGELSPEVIAAEVNKSAQTTEASERARLNVYFDPKFVSQRYAELQQKAQLELQTAGDKDKQQLMAEQGRAVSQVAPSLARVIELTDQLATSEGVLARVAGWLQRGGAATGTNDAAVQLQSELAKMTRPLAVTVLGVREANVSNTEQEMVANGLGIKLGNTRGERVAALRNLRSAIFVGPEVTKRLPYNATPADRLNLTRQLIRAQQAAEDEAIANWNKLAPAQQDQILKQNGGGTPMFMDPVTQSPMPIVSY